MTDLFLYDDAAARGFEPFALTRPVCELRAGALLLRERWELALSPGRVAAGVVAAPHLADFDEPWGVAIARGTLPRGALLAHSRFAVALGPAPAGDVWRSGGRVAAVLLPRDVPVAELGDGTLALETLARPDGRVVDVGGRWLDHVWDAIAMLSPMLAEDVVALAPGARQLTQGMISGPHGVFVEPDATVEPQVYFDTHAGPVLVRRGASVAAFTRIVGPCVIGEESQVGGDKISGSSIGNVCRVHGEVSSSIFLGHANKAHDGFLGHSYLGRWANLGAGTITSNLKNTYGTVQLWTPAGLRDTGLQFLGTLLGDHAKTGIGMTLNTGTVIGTGANIYGGVMPPKVVPPFAWGDQAPYSSYRMDKFLEVAEKVMSRRQVALSARQARLLSAAFAARWTAQDGPS